MKNGSRARLWSLTGRGRCLLPSQESPFSAGPGTAGTDGALAFLGTVSVLCVGTSFHVVRATEIEPRYLLGGHPCFTALTFCFKFQNSFSM